MCNFLNNDSLNSNVLLGGPLRFQKSEVYEEGHDTADIFIRQFWLLSYLLVGFYFISMVFLSVCTKDISVRLGLIIDYTGLYL